MLGNRRSVSFWRPKKRLLEMVRALRGSAQPPARPAMPARALAAARQRDRLAAEAERKARFAER